VDQDNERYVYIKKQIDVWDKLNKDAQMQLQQLNHKAKDIESQIINRAGAIQGYRTLMKKRL
jgi:hypothetical protein